jgi:hypothetical protein
MPPMDMQGLACRYLSTGTNDAAVASLIICLRQQGTSQFLWPIFARRAKIAHHKEANTALPKAQMRRLQMSDFENQN